LKWCLHHKKEEEKKDSYSMSFNCYTTYIHTREFFPTAPVASQNIQVQRQQINTHLVEMGLMVPIVFAQLITEGKQGTLETMTYSKKHGTLTNGFSVN
jgi:hypothetical protein